MSQKICIIEDEEKLAAVMAEYLAQQHYHTHVIGNGREALEWLQKNPVDLILLDLMLPEMDGLTLCRELRKTSNVPIIMVTARVDEIDRLIGLEIGADDYVCKPFSPREVVARVKAVLRRGGGGDGDASSPPGSGIKLDTATAQVSLGGKMLSLTAVEFKLLQTLSKSPGRIFSRNQLMDKIYSDSRIVSDRTIDSHVKKLRQKLQQLQPDAELIHSVYGMGYKFEDIA